MKSIKFYSYCLIGLVTALFAGYQFHIYTLKHAAQQDINFMHQAFLENHPGVYNDQDPHFVHNMNEAYQEAKNSINSMKTSNDHENIIKNYLENFHDPHIKFRPKIQHPVSEQKSEHEHFSINQIVNDIAWITLPTFQPNKEQQKELEIIIDQISQYQKSKLIVLDLRSNDGGNSEWGTKILKNLFGQEYLDQRFDAINKKMSTDWRASKDNIAHIAFIINYMKDQFGADSSLVSEFKEIEDGMQQAYKDHKAFYTIYTQEEEEIAPTIEAINPVTAKIVVITSSRCFSSCLIFIDEIKIVDPKAILIGQTTSADTIYLDMRAINLPSGIGSFRTPIKIHRGRPRGNNMPYIPNISYPENINSEEEKNQWLLETVEKLSQG